VRLLVIRHAIAEELGDDDGRTDAERQLTKRGRKRMREAARGLRRVVDRLDVLAASPLVRAKQTAEVVSRAYGGMRVTEVEALANKPVTDVLRWMQGQATTDDLTVALVGHEPQLGMLVSWLLSGERRSFVTCRKGGACLLDFGKGVKSGRAKLLWMLTPSSLRKLGKYA
jgi:phosphohistidine phosphatase